MEPTGHSSFRIAFSFVVFLFLVVPLFIFVFFFVFRDFSNRDVGSDHPISRNRSISSAHAQWYARSMERRSVPVATHNGLLGTINHRSIRSRTPLLTLSLPVQHRTLRRL